MDVGDRFGKLVVIESVRATGVKTKWRCLCDCGNESIIRQDHLNSGATMSCGCLAAETNGAYKTRTYSSWSSMRQRCLNPKAPNYQNYGGRGVHICARWLESFENFLADMGVRPAGTTLERDETNQNYEPGNCRWATPKEQARNRRNNRLVEFEGEEITMSEAAERSGVNLTTFKYRLDKKEANAHLCN